MSQVSVIFDLDGTLLDTLDDLAITCNEVLETQGYPVHPRDAYRTFVGGGLSSLMAKVTPSGTGKDQLKRCCRLFEHGYQKSWKRNSCPYEGINDMLSALKKHDIPLAVLSNKPHDFTVKMSDFFFTEKTFAQVYGQRDGFPKKPDPTVALEIAGQLQTRAEDTLFVGDSGVDIVTGKAAGMMTAGVSWGFRSIRELTRHNADIIIHNPQELVQYVISSR